MSERQVVRRRSLVHVHHLTHDFGHYSCVVYIDPEHRPALIAIPGVLLVAPDRGVDCRFTLEWDPRYLWDDIEWAIKEIVSAPAPMLLDEMPVEEI